MASTKAERFGRRLLVALVDELAESNPRDVFAAFPYDQDLWVWFR